MGSVNEMLKDIPIPRMVRVREKFNGTAIGDVAEAVRKELNRAEVIEKILPGMTIALTAGSRGVANIALVIRETVSFLKEHGAKPFVIPAMGSHGGSTAEGQLAIIHEYGVTEEYVGCPVIHGKYESGVMKMLTIGLGCQFGAQVCHRQGIMHLGPNVEKFAFGILKNANVILGIGLVENAFDQTEIVRVMTKEQIPIEEPILLEKAKSLMAKILFPSVDVLVVDYIGKNISGEGMDPNVSGRWIVPNIQGGIDAQRIAVLDITDETLGNVVGLGMADTCSKRVVDKMDRDQTYPNSLTSTVTCLCRIPMYFDTQKLTIQAAIKMTAGVEPEDVTMIRIRDTLSLGEIWISENLIPKAKENPMIEIIGEPEYMDFDENGNLF